MAYDVTKLTKLAALKALAEKTKSELDKKVGSVGAKDNSVVLGGSATAPTIGVKISPVAGNALALDNTEGQEGLKVVVPAAAEYSIVEAASPETGYLKSYELQKDGTKVGASINIPKDFLVKSGEVKTVTTADQPYEGAKVGDKYIDFVVNVKSGSSTDEHIYLPVNDLVDVYTSGSAAGDTVVIAVGNDNKITATITDGTITKAKLAEAVQTELNKAHTHADGAKDIVTVSGDLSYDADTKALSYSHPTTTAIGAGFVKVGKDDKGHVVIGDAVAAADITGITGLVATDTEVSEMLTEVFGAAAE